MSKTEESPVAVTIKPEVTLSTWRVGGGGRYGCALLIKMKGSGWVFVSQLSEVSSVVEAFRQGMDNDAAIQQLSRWLSRFRLTVNDLLKENTEATLRVMGEVCTALLDEAQKNGCSQPCKTRVLHGFLRELSGEDPSGLRELIQGALAGLGKYPTSVAE